MAITTTTTTKYWSAASRKSKRTKTVKENTSFLCTIFSFLNCSNQLSSDEILVMESLYIFDRSKCPTMAKMSVCYITSTTTLHSIIKKHRNIKKMWKHLYFILLSVLWIYTVLHPLLHFNLIVTCSQITTTSLIDLWLILKVTLCFISHFKLFTCIQ